RCHFGDFVNPARSAWFERKFPRTIHHCKCKRATSATLPARSLNLVRRTTTVLSNLKMVFKVSLIACVVGVAMLGVVGYMANGLTSLDAAYSDVIERVDASAIVVARAARRAESYREAAFELLTETTDAGNARLLKVTQEASASVLAALN